MEGWGSSPLVSGGGGAAGGWGKGAVGMGGARGGAVFEVSCPSPTFLDADTQLFLALGWLGKWAGSSGC